MFVMSQKLLLRVLFLQPGTTLAGEAATTGLAGEEATTGLDGEQNLGRVLLLRTGYCGSTPFAVVVVILLVPIGLLPRVIKASDWVTGQIVGSTDVMPCRAKVWPLGQVVVVGVIIFSLWEGAAAGATGGTDLEINNSCFMTNSWFFVSGNWVCSAGSESAGGTEKMDFVVTLWVSGRMGIEGPDVEFVEMEGEHPGTVFLESLSGDDLW